ncbi:PTS sugar transporter subunit IIB [Brochothrix campestris]|uniref:PTS system lactose/cellobiose specific transporter subunit IIB n=1 Tax=Brochothrix campestris FSL F6-1037 TaxID=1265861 RepID=W7CMW4_9LIST|nr:PTS sugar transporter subunit IIB [Brochothrix campestris]EUJ38015.1 PTS system lactose/cellobiose specific transporter subunit IIB [Brochothrix campestris FSL F6-1037]
MERVLLICGAGASSGFMAQAIRKAAKKEGYELKCEARSEAQLNEYLSEIDILLIGPHLAYIKAEIMKQIGDLPIKVEVMPQSIYGMLDGKKALELIKTL